MITLIGLRTADHWEDQIFINPDDISVIKRYIKDRDLGEYSTVVMKNGEHVNVCGSPTHVMEVVRIKGGEE